jgi:hypothetical protein
LFLNISLDCLFIGDLERRGFTIEVNVGIFEECLHVDNVSLLWDILGTISDKRRVL